MNSTPATPFVDHVLHSAAAAATNADHFDDRAIPFLINDLKHAFALQGKQTKPDSKNNFDVFQLTNRR